MNKKEKVKGVIKILEDFFPHPQIPLHHKNAYTLLLALILSAQCTDERVNQTTPLLFSKANIVASFTVLNPPFTLCLA